MVDFFITQILAFISQGVVQDERSEGEVAGDVVSTLLTRIRQSVWRGRPSRAGDAASVGEVEERATQPCMRCVCLCRVVLCCVVLCCVVCVPCRVALCCVVVKVAS
jgi:hypothetical protein